MGEGHNETAGVVAEVLSVWSEGNKAELVYQVLQTSIFSKCGQILPKSA